MIVIGKYCNAQQGAVHGVLCWGNQGALAQSIGTLQVESVLGIITRPNSVK